MHKVEFCQGWWSRTGSDEATKSLFLECSATDGLIPQPKDTLTRELSHHGGSRGGGTLCFIPSLAVVTTHVPHAALK